MRHLTRILIVATASALGGACGSSGSSGRVAPQSSAATVASPTSTGAQDGFCASGPELDRALTAEDTTDDQLDAALDRATADAPGALRPSLEAIRSAVDKARAGEPDALHSSAYSDALGALTDYFVDGCGFGHLDVTAVDYAYEGVPAEVEPGPTVLRLRDAGAELHMAIVVRIADDYQGTVADLVTLPDEESDKVATELGVVFVDPGATSSTVLDLEPGRYALVCAVPVGTTPEVAEKSRNGGPEPEGPPHASRGMFAELRVTG